MRPMLLHYGENTNAFMEARRGRPRVSALTDNRLSVRAEAVLTSVRV